MKRIAESLQILLDKVQKTQYILVDILHTSPQYKVALPINDVLLTSAKVIWQIPTIIPPICKRTNTRYYGPPKGLEYLSSDPTPNSLLMDAVNESHKHCTKSIPHDRELKHLELLSSKSYSSAVLQLWVANNYALMVKYDQMNYSKFTDFSDYLP
ncbi:hypothetical protein G0U57_015436 [Chelydra serpentina]|uniref:Uncharacterized protein n=1 Tax=Chelydra serpentina TaxID=8475 RepID=A0A8T1T345_CHESE|nr:hypothetical protein G0U57_015436 [Chelydra serpentina]